MALTHITKNAIRGLYQPSLYRIAIGYSLTLPQNILELQLTEEPSLSANCNQIIESNGDLTFEGIHSTSVSFTANYCALVKYSGAIDLEIIAISPFIQNISIGSTLTTYHKIAIKANV